jgi:hypothetical protein
MSKHYYHDGALVRHADVASVPEVYVGFGRWDAHPDPTPIHEGRLLDADEVDDAIATIDRAGKPTAEPAYPAAARKAKRPS